MPDNNDSDNSEKIVVRVDPDLEELIPEYLENRHKDTESISQLLDDEGFDNIRILGHSMKGSGGGYGFDRISEVGKTIEDVTLSIGVSMAVPNIDLSPGKLIEAADKALYAAKQKGRNRVEVSDYE